MSLYDYLICEYPLPVPGPHRPAPTAVAVLSCSTVRDTPYRATHSKEDAA